MEKKRSKSHKPAGRERGHTPSNSRRSRAVNSLADVTEHMDRLQARLIESELQNTDLRQAQEDAQRYSQIYVELYEHSPISHLILDRNGVILRANQTAGELLGLDASRLIRKPFLLFVMRETLNEYRAHCREAILTRQRVTCDVLLRPRTAEPFWGRLDTVGMHDLESDELVCHMAVVPFLSSDRPVAKQHRSDESESHPEVDSQPRADAEPSAAHLDHDVHDLKRVVAGIKSVLQLLKSIVPGDHPYTRYIPLAEEQLDRILEAAARHTEGG